MLFTLFILSCTPKHIIAKKERNGNIDYIAAQKIFNDRYHITTGIEFDSSYVLGNCIVFVYSYERRTPPIPLVIGIMVDGIQQTYDIDNRYDLERLASSSNLSINSVNDADNYLGLYLRSSYYNNYKIDTLKLSKTLIKYHGRFVKDKFDIINVIEKAYHISKVQVDSLINELPNIDSKKIEDSNNSYIFEGAFIDWEKLELLLLKVKVKVNGEINILSEEKLLAIDPAKKLQRILIM